MTSHQQKGVAQTAEDMVIRKQRGAALITVLLFLTVSLMVGLSSMQSAQIDERLAGNYKAAAEAQMYAEGAASALYGMLGKKEVWSDFGEDELSGDFGWKAFYKVAADKESDSHCHVLDNDSGVACYVSVSGKYLGLQEGRYIIAMGSVDGAMAEGGPVFVRMAPPGLTRGLFAAASVIGDIEAGALGLSSVGDSSVSGGVYQDEEGGDVEINSLVMEEGLDSYDIDSVVNGDAGLDGSNVSYYELGPQLVLDRVKDLYDAYGQGGADGVEFYTDGLTLNGKEEMSGVHVVLGGNVEISDESLVRGVLIVLNLGDNSVDDDAWDRSLLGTIDGVALKSDGEKGSVWFDEDAVRDSLGSVGMTMQDFFGDEAGAGGTSDAERPRINSWN